MIARKPTGSEAERSLGFQLRAVGIPFEREVQFAKPRKWRADFVMRTGPHKQAEELGPGRCDFCYEEWPPTGPCTDLFNPLLVEVDGGTWVGGRHTTGSGFARDAEKLNRATELGYRVLRFTPAMVEDGSALAQIERCLA